MKIIDRVFQYIEYKKIKPARFEKNIGLSNGYLATQLKRKADLGESVIIKILDNSLDISIDWLIRGNGSMIISKSASSMIFNDPEVEYGCKSCKMKDEVIEALRETNTLLKEKVANFEKRNKGKNPDYSQTA